MTGKLLITGCGILKNEIEYLVKKNNWDYETVLYDSSLHVDFNKLGRTLEGALEMHSGRDVVVFYGTCHPKIDDIIGSGDAVRTIGQNCVEMLLGKELFTLQLSKGAFFLMEDWVHRWEYITSMAFGDSPETIRMIFESEHEFLLCIRTPCSSDFSIEADNISTITGLPLQWMDVSLDHLEKVLLTAINEKAGNI